MMMSLAIPISGLESWLAHPMMEQVGWVLVHAVWQGALLAGLLAGALFLLRSEQARLRYAISLITLVVLAACPVITWSVLSATPVEPAGAVEASWQALSEPAVLLAETNASAGSGMTWSAAARAGLVASLPGLAIVWMLGVGVLAVRLAGGWMLTVRLRNARSEPVDGPWQRRVNRLAERLGVTWPVRLRQSASIDVPMVVGWLRPVVLVPAGVLTGLPPQQIEALIAHELSHIRRHDVLIGWLQALVETLLFYHPAVWWISEQVRVEREHCCDDLAVAVCRDRVTYAQALTTLAGRQQVILAGSLGASGGALLERIRRLVGGSEEVPRRGYRPPLVVVSIVVVASMIGIAACATQRPAGDESQATLAAAQATPSPDTDSGSDPDTSRNVSPSSRKAVDVYIAERSTEENGGGMWKRRVVVDSSGHVTVWSDSGRARLQHDLDSLDGIRAVAPRAWRLFGQSDTIPRPPHPLRLRRAPFDTLAFSFPDPPDIEWEAFRGLDSLRIPPAVAPPAVFFLDRDTVDLGALRLRMDSLRVEWPRGFPLDSLERIRIDSLRQQVERQVRHFKEEHREEVERMRREARELQRELRYELRREQPERLREQAEALRRQAERLEEQARELEERRPPAPDTTSMSSRRHPVPFDAAPLGALRAGSGSRISRRPSESRSSASIYVAALGARSTGRTPASATCDA